MRIGKKAVILILLDIILVMAALYVAAWLRFDGQIPRSYLDALLDLLPVFAVIYISSFFCFECTTECGSTRASPNS